MDDENGKMCFREWNFHISFFEELQQKDSSVGSKKIKNLANEINS